MIPVQPGAPLIGASLRALKQRFLSLPAPALSDLAGIYRAEFVGPAWLRTLAQPALALGGLRGWWGKAFDGQGGAANLVVRKGQRCRVLPMTVVTMPSLLDGRSAIALRYPPGSPLPWPWIIDEVRRLDKTTLLCMTLVNLTWLPRVPFPFLLHRTEE